VDHMSGHSEHHPAPEPGEAAEPAAAHGMAVIGEHAVYLSHLPMFMSPHDQQALLAVEFEGDGDPQQVYFDDRGQHPQQRLYTFDPDRFVLSGLFPVGNSSPEVTSFRGALHRGHFERPATSPVRIAEDVTARVRKVIHHHKFEADAQELEELQYFLFGKGSEIFLAHRITKAPDYDHLLSIGIDQPLSDGDLSKEIVVKFSDRPNTVAARIKPDVEEQLSAVAEIDGGSRPIQLRPKVEFYFEARELAEAM
jgi:hypothetical protein